jgi:hypothetical protein
MDFFSLQSLLRRRLVRFLLAAFFLQWLYVAFRVHENKKVSALITEAHDSTRLALSSHNQNAIEDFGLIANKVAALADFAENCTNNAVDSPELNKLITEHFPWWNDSTLQYFPWM